MAREKRLFDRVQNRTTRWNGQTPRSKQPSCVLRKRGACRDYRHTHRFNGAQTGRGSAARSEERFRTLVQFSFDVYWESDAQHRFTRQEFAEGLADAPVPGSDIGIGKTRWELPHLEPAKRPGASIGRRSTPICRSAISSLRAQPDGGKRYWSVSGLPVFDETGRFVGYRGLGRQSPSANEWRKLSASKRRSFARSSRPFPR